MLFEASPAAAPDNLGAMPVQQLPRALLQFVDDEMLRAPLLFDRLIDGTLDDARRGLPLMSPGQRAAVGDLMQALMVQRLRLAEHFTRSLREQVQAELERHVPQPAHKTVKPRTLALVDEDEVALDVELSRAIEAIKRVAEYELQELQTFASALVGDMDVAADHNPFRAETYAQALWAAASALPMSRSFQVAFMRHACEPLARLLRTSYAASSSRLEAMGVEPAAYRTLILPSGSRRGARSVHTTFSPDLRLMRDSMPVPLDETLSFEGQPPAAPAAPAPAGTPRHEHWSEVARHTTNQGDRQAIELVSRLFEAMMADERVPPDVSLIISRLHGPAMRLMLRDGSVLDQDKHPLWLFINLLAYEAEMAPDRNDPERAHLLRAAQAVVDQLAGEAEQGTGLYRVALERMRAYLQKRLTRRIAAAASQVGQLQKLEDRLVGDQASLSTLHGMLDVPQLDTVPAELMDAPTAAPPVPTGAEAWLRSLAPGDWVRMFLQGRWVHSRLLWPGERREVWLFGDGASDATWAVRRGALLMMHGARLAKTLKQRSIVGSAAARVHRQMSEKA
jgi:hypothetical protein